MRQFVLPAYWRGAGEVRIGERETRHLVRVLRLGPGDRFPAIDAEGLRHECELLSIEGGAAILSVGVGQAVSDSFPLADLRGSDRGYSSRHEAHDTLSQGQESPLEGAGRQVAAKLRDATHSHDATHSQVATGLPRIVLAAAMLKGEKFDHVIRQATEAGVARIIPLATARSLGRAAGAARVERQARIVREALQQSGSTVPTICEEAIGLRELPESLGNPAASRLSLLFHEMPLAKASLHEYLGPRPDEVVICIGPEGGFAADEVAFLLGGAFVPFRLPGAVLRAETAAIFAIAAVQIVVSEHDSWSPAQA
ncbi:MAG TPA: RsmE family RNA methyltransferase [Rectinemataceae bacterium]|nr:RsmE family RNA methyltransferase [Rectinemataceae bacterium]